jgi:hypothetical protein
MQLYHVTWFISARRHAMRQNLKFLVSPYKCLTIHNWRHIARKTAQFFALPRRLIPLMPNTILRTIPDRFTPLRDTQSYANVDIHFAQKTCTTANIRDASDQNENHVQQDPCAVCLKSNESLKRMNSVIIGIVLQKTKRIKLDHVSCNYKTAYKGHVATIVSTVNLLLMGLIIYNSEN